ncbi:MAG: hypothetical protein ORN58_02965, partial [Sediminibacterium sp.]|nr:hypothetical protein [Sediminibacterium sp.]
MYYNTQQLYSAITAYIKSLNIFSYVSIDYGQFDLYFRDKGLKLKQLGNIDGVNEIINLPAIAIRLVENENATLMGYFRNKEVIKLKFDIFMSNLNAQAVVLNNVIFVENFINRFKTFNFGDAVLVTKPTFISQTDEFNTTS